MRRSCCLVLAVLALAAATGCHRGQVGLPIVPGSDRHAWRDPLDLQAYRAPARLLLYTAEPPVGYAEARHRPGRSLAIALRLNWNAAVRPLPEAFERLCERHNKADIALSEFTARENELRAALSDIAELKSRLDGLLTQYEAHLPISSAEGPDIRAAARALRTQAKGTNEQAAARIAEVSHEPTEGPPEDGTTS